MRRSEPVVFQKNKCSLTGLSSGHRLVHNYDDTNWLIIAEVVFADLPQYMEQIRDILADIVSRAE